MNRIVLFLILFFCTSSLYANLVDSWYVAGDVGPNFMVDYRLPDMDSHFDVGFTASVALGIAWNSHFRTELEGNWRRNTINDITVNGNSANVNGYLEEISIFYNVLYDLPACWPIVPYLGGGFGIGFERASLEGSNLPREHHHEKRWAVQAIVGASYWLMDCLQLSLDYRFFPIDEDVLSHAAVFGLIRTS
jgi:opacity protein-like surface antigen